MIETTVSKPRMQDYTAELFEPLVGRVFVFRRPEGQAPESVALELLRVTAGPAMPAAAARNPQLRSRSFSLMFALQPGMEPLGKGLHVLCYDDFEPCEWFLTRVVVPTGDPRVAYYEAVFG